jgi:hypothetical protein
MNTTPIRKFPMRLQSAAAGACIRVMSPRSWTGQQRDLRDHHGSLLLTARADQPT